MEEDGSLLPAEGGEIRWRGDSANAVVSENGSACGCLQGPFCLLNKEYVQAPSHVISAGRIEPPVLAACVERSCNRVSHSSTSLATRRKRSNTKSSLSVNKKRISVYLQAPHDVRVVCAFVCPLLQCWLLVEGTAVCACTVLRMVACCTNSQQGLPLLPCAGPSKPRPGKRRVLVIMPPATRRTGRPFSLHCQHWILGTYVLAVKCVLITHRWKVL